MNTSKEIQSISLENLLPFPNHPFDLYERSRIDEMVKSAKENGVLEPLLVRTSGDKFETFGEGICH
jgi:ParB family chromosome partitioning protein